MARFFSPISIKDLRKKVEDKWGKDARQLVRDLGSDLKVQFDPENFYWTGGFGLAGLMGVNTMPNGMTYWGLCAGGDWEFPVFFIVYWDGKRLRGYSPTDGNPWNLSTKEAYGNNDKEDLQDAKRRWPELFADAESVEVADFEFNPELISADIQARILPRPVKEVKPEGSKKNEAKPTASAVSWADLVGLKITAFRGQVWDDREQSVPLEFILFNDEATFIEVCEQDYYEYHDCSHSARHLTLRRDAAQWGRMFRQEGVFRKSTKTSSDPF